MVAQLKPSSRKQPYIFRADASEKIGHGHVMRCFTLASALLSRGASCVFVSSSMPEQLAALVNSAGIEVISVDRAAVQQDQIADAKQTLEVIKRYSAQKVSLVVDHYALDAKWESRLKPHLEQLIVIDDLANRPHDCTILLDQTLGRVPMEYHGLLQSDTKVLTGLDFSLLRPAFAARQADAIVRRFSLECPESILINFGGSDADALLYFVIDSLRNDPLLATLHYHIISPFVSEAVKTLIAESKLNTAVYSHIEDMAEQLINVDLAIGAAGSSAWERCVLGLPAVMFVLADNQALVAKALSQAGAAMLVSSEDQGKSLIDSLQCLLRKELYRKVAVNALSLCDGKGVDRVVEHILGAADSQGEDTFAGLELRPATQSDAELVFEWRNDEASRANSLSQDTIEFSAHLAWFTAALDNPARQIFMLLSQGKIVGMVRADHEQNETTLSWMVGPDHRGKGLAKRMVAMAAKQFTQTLHAVIKAHNLASVHVALSAGFRLVKEKDGVLYFSRSAIV